MRNKKFVVVFALILAVMLVFAGCGSKAKDDSQSGGSPISSALNIEGTTWKLTTWADENGEELTGDNLITLLGETTYTFNSDFKGVCNSDISGEVPFDYTIDGSKVTIKDVEGDTIFTVTGDTMVSDPVEGTIFTLTKQ